MDRLAEDAIRALLDSVPAWSLTGSILTRTLAFVDFPAAMHFVNEVARVAEELQHHPDIDIRWNRVTLSLTTHDAGGLTRLDFELAQRLDRLGDKPGDTR